MAPRSLINFTCLSSKKADYTLACEVLGTSLSSVCRMALDNTVLLAKKLQPEKFSPSPSLPPINPSSLQNLSIINIPSASHPENPSGEDSSKIPSTSATPVLSLETDEPKRILDAHEKTNTNKSKSPRTLTYTKPKSSNPPTKDEEIEAFLGVKK